MTRKHAQLTASLAAGFILLAAVLFLTVMQAPPIASADTVPTPAAIQNQSQSAELITFIDSDTSTTDNSGSTGIQMYTLEYCNLQWIIDEDVTTAPNTTTLTAQWSMDNSTWSDGPAIVAAAVADGDGVVQVPNLGRYMRIAQDHTGAQPITVTAKAVCK